MKNLFLIFLLLSLSLVTFGQGTTNYPGSVDTATTLLQAANNAQSTLSGSITSGSTSLTLASASSFPTSGTITIESEIIFYSGKSTNTLTGLMRGQDSTTAASHTSGRIVRATITARHHNVLRDSIIAIQNKLGIGASTPGVGKVLTYSGGGTAWVDATLIPGITVNTNSDPDAVKISETDAQTMAGALGLKRTAYIQGDGVKTIDLLGGEVDADQYSSLSAAITAIGSTQTTLRISSTQTVSANLTIPTTITIKRTGTGKFSLASGVVLTLNCDVEADRSQLFVYADNTSRVAFGQYGKVSTLKPEWWGAKGDATQDNWLYLQRMFDSVTPGLVGTSISARILLTQGIYDHTDRLVWIGDQSSSLTIESDMPTPYGAVNASVLRYTGADGGEQFYTSGANRIVLKGVGFNSNAKSRVGFHPDGSNEDSTSPINITNATRVGNAVEFTLASAHSWGTVNSATITDVARTSGTKLSVLTTAAPHGATVSTLTAPSFVHLYIAGNDTTTNGVWRAEVTGTSTFTFVQSGTTNTYAGGTVKWSFPYPVDIAGISDYGLSTTFPAILTDTDKFAVQTAVTLTDTTGTATRTYAKSSNGIHVEGCTFYGFHGAGSAGLALAHPTGATPQVATLVVKDSIFIGSATGREWFGIFFEVGGNAKNYVLSHNAFAQTRHGINAREQSGPLIINNKNEFSSFYTGATAICIFTGGATTLVESSEIETIADTMFLVQVGRMGKVTLIANDWQGQVPSDGVFITIAGRLQMTGNNWLDPADTGRIPTIQATIDLSGINTGAIDSSVNFFANAGISSVFEGYIPIVNGSGDKVLTAAGTGNNVGQNVLSIGDQGGSDETPENLYSPGTFNHIRSQRAVGTPISTTGFIRVNNADAIKARVNANNADYNWLTGNTSNEVHLGDTSGFRFGDLTNYTKFTSAATTPRTIAFPDATGTVALRPGSTAGYSVWTTTGGALAASSAYQFDESTEAIILTGAAGNPSFSFNSNGSGAQGLIKWRTSGGTNKWYIGSNQYSGDGLLEIGDNIKLWVSLVPTTGFFGLNTTAPERQFNINSSTGATLRHTYNDADGSAANYVDESVSSGGDFTIAPSGGDTNITGALAVSTTLGVTTSASIPKLSNLSTNGFVKTGSGDGTLSVDTATYTSSETCYLTSDATSTSATLADLTGCTISNLTSGSKYGFKAILYISNSIAADGVKIDFGGGSATSTNFRAQCTGFDSALAISTQVTSLTGTCSSATFTGAGSLEIHGSFEPSGNGTIIPRFAENASTTGTLTVFRGSHIIFWKLP